MQISSSAISQIKKNAKYLRITVEAGGCFGFRYELSYINELHHTDIVLNDYIATDLESYLIVKNLEIDFKSEIGFEDFVIQNLKSPTCGCGKSFA